MPLEEQLVVNESVLALMALRATPAKVATTLMCASELKAMRLPATADEALLRLADPTKAVRARRWQHARDFLLVRAKGPVDCLLRRLDDDLFQMVVMSCVDA